MKKLIIIAFAIFTSFSCKKENFLKPIEVEYDVVTSSSQQSKATIWWADKDEKIQNSFFYVPWKYSFSTSKPFTAVLAAFVVANDGDYIVLNIYANKKLVGHKEEKASGGQGVVYLEIQQIIQ